MKSYSRCSSDAYMPACHWVSRQQRQNESRPCNKNVKRFNALSYRATGRWRTYEQVQAPYLLRMIRVSNNLIDVFNSAARIKWIKNRSQQQLIKWILLKKEKHHSKILDQSSQTRRFGNKRFKVEHKRLTKRLTSDCLENWFYGKWFYVRSFW